LDKYEVLPNGAKQSKVDTRFDLLPPHAILSLSRVLAEGAAKYGDNNWYGIPAESHLNHMMRHLYLQKTGDTSEDHMAHRFCRAAMFFEKMMMDQEAKNGNG
jgi:hypothetical protein